LVLEFVLVVEFQLSLFNMILNSLLPIPDRFLPLLFPAF
jgi:hypothetical protein